MTDKPYIKLDFRASQSLSLEGLRNEISRHIQTGRKTAGLAMTDKVTAELHSTDEFVLAAARNHRDYLVRECQLDGLDVYQSDRDYIAIGGHKLPFDPAKWHSPVAWRDGDVYYDGNDYPHYWVAVYDNYPTKTGGDNEPTK